MQSFGTLNLVMILKNHLANNVCITAQESLLEPVFSEKHDITFIKLVQGVSLFRSFFKNKNKSIELCYWLQSVLRCIMGYGKLTLKTCQLPSNKPSK